jgi:hypothetical protein
MNAFSMAAVTIGVMCLEMLTSVAAELPHLTVRVYSYPGVPEERLDGAEQIAGNLLQQMSLNWVNCGAVPTPCTTPDLSTDLVVRIVKNAMANASAKALGETVTAPNGREAAFIFYDRILAQWTNQVPVFNVLGKVLAHEVTHLLVPEEGHSRNGLMRSAWNRNDLEFRSLKCHGLPPRFVRLMENEARRRAELANHVLEDRPATVADMRQPEAPYD